MWCLDFDPTYESVASILKAVIRGDAGPEDVAGVKYEEVAINERVDFAFNEYIRFLEWMIMGMRDRRWLIIHHEHRVKLRSHLLVDEHLDGDTAVCE